MIALALEGHLINAHIPSILEKVHAQGRGQDADLLLPARLADGHALIAPRYQNPLPILDQGDDLLQGFPFGDNHRTCAPLLVC